MQTTSIAKMSIVPPRRSVLELFRVCQIVSVVVGLETKVFAESVC